MVNGDWKTCLSGKAFENSPFTNHHLPYPSHRIQPKSSDVYGWPVRAARNFPRVQLFHCTSSRMPCPRWAARWSCCQCLQVPHRSFIASMASESVDILSAPFNGWCIVTYVLILYIHPSIYIEGVIYRLFGYRHIQLLLFFYLTACNIRQTFLYLDNNQLGSILMPMEYIF